MNDELQLVALHLGGETYGVDIAHIHTVIMPQTITPVPKAPSFVQGVMNLRGRIVPVVDLRKRFGLAPLGEDPASQKGVRIVIVDGGKDGLSAGLIVDAVSEVLRVPLSAIDPPSALVSTANGADCVSGIGRIPSGEGRRVGDPSGVATERLILLLDVFKTLTPDLPGGDIVAGAVAA